MKATVLSLGVVLFSAASVAGQPLVPAPVPSHPQQSLVTRYCMGCHNDRTQVGRILLDGARPGQSRRQCRKPPRRSFDACAPG